MATLNVPTIRTPTASTSATSSESESEDEKPTENVYKGSKQEVVKVIEFTSIRINSPNIGTSKNWFYVQAHTSWWLEMEILCAI